MSRPTYFWRGPGPLMITALLACEVAYRLLFRESIRRALGMVDGSDVSTMFSSDAHTTA